MLKLSSHQNIPPLQQHYWPPVNYFDGFSQDFKTLFRLSSDAQHHFLNGLRKESERYGQFLHEALATIYAYSLGYQDSPCYLKTDESLERQLLSMKLVLETELLQHDLPMPTFPQGLSQQDAAEYLRVLLINNSSLSHPLFEYLETAPESVLLVFLQQEVMRNEVVDDEVSLLVAGLQGPMKIAVTSNLWDECGHGRLINAHTYWLRRILEKTNNWKNLTDYRRVSPWFSKIASNVFLMLLTRPGLKLSAYGYFLVSESLVPPHFEKILAGLKRVGMTQEDITIYFDAHLKIDKYHGQDLLDAVSHQKPALTQPEIELILLGAHFHITASTKQYSQMLSYLSSLQ
jgi:hypothetical protein